MHAAEGGVAPDSGHNDQQVAITPFSGLPGLFYDVEKMLATCTVYKTAWGSGRPAATAASPAHYSVSFKNEYNTQRVRTRAYIPSVHHSAVYQIYL